MTLAAGRENPSAMKIKTGKGEISLTVLLAIWSVSAISSLPGLAISPVLGNLHHIFPDVTKFEIQMLSSLPSLLIIPFVLISGRLSIGRDKLRILTAGLVIFFLSGVACLFADSMASLIIISCVLGVGAGMVIPMSTGLVVDYFTGKRRVRQLGYSSAINNFSLVFATVVTGYLADVEWHLPFLVYTLPGASLVLSFFLKRQRSSPEPEQSLQLRYKSLDRRKLAGVMALYLFVTYAVITVSFYAAFLVDEYRIDSEFSGILISVCFLAMMIPGLFIYKIIGWLRRNINLVSLAMLGVGLLCMGLFRERAALLAGALLAGFGYGIMQPVIYDKAATIGPPRTATFALSLVMAMNYLAVMACPFVINAVKLMLDIHGSRFPFLLNAGLVLVLTIAAVWLRRGFTIGLDESYYKDEE